MTSSKRAAKPTLLNHYHLLTFDELDSTNEEAKRLAKSGGCHGAVIWAKRQTAGKGRLSRTWISEEGNLFVSVLLRPERPLAELPQLSFVAGVAACEAMAALIPEGEKLALKWPNDLLLNEKKLGGLLLESFQSEPNSKPWVVVGLGVNVESAPANVGQPTVSLKAAGVELISAKIILSRFIHHFIAEYDQWAAKGFTRARKSWLQHAARLGENVTLRLPEGEVVGIAEGMDAGGNLILRVGKKRVAYAAGELA